MVKHMRNEILKGGSFDSQEVDDLKNKGFDDNKINTLQNLNISFNQIMQKYSTITSNGLHENLNIIIEQVMIELLNELMIPEKVSILSNNSNKGYDGGYRRKTIKRKYNKKSKKIKKKY